MARELGEVEIDVLCTAAVAKWGIERQLDMVVEECAELQKAICKYRRGKGTADILEEAIDVELMLRQVRLMFGYREDLKQAKLERLARLLEKETK